MSILPSYLIQALQVAPNYSSILWIADENSASLIEHGKVFSNKITVLTNRYDIYEKSEDLGFRSFFNDFDFTPIANQSFDLIIYGVSKERAVTHRVFNQVSHITLPTTACFFGGKKQEGIKNYGAQLTKTLGFEGKLKKDKDHYWGVFKQVKQPEKQLDDKDYTRYREVVTTEFGCFFSKPGLYGWEKEDVGSHFLVEQIIADINTYTGAQPHPKHLLDLGCGYGYLTCSLLSQQTLLAQNLTQITLTDNNAAALSAALLNCEKYCADSDITYSVLASDCAKGITDRFDVILCNPPFHLGFDTSDDLTEKFVASAAGRTNKQGLAYFVTNAFVGIEKYAQRFYGKVDRLENNGQFKVLRLSAPKV